MRNASRSIYLSFHTALSIFARTVGAAPVLQNFSLIEKRALAKDISKGEAAGYVVFIILLVVLSGITAGLTLGLMSLDETQRRFHNCQVFLSEGIRASMFASLLTALVYVLSQSGSPKQKRHAAKIIPIRKNGHLLLVSLLLMNVISNETLPIISEKILGSGVISVVASTVMIVIFSEILPQAICSTHGLAIGAAMAIPVKVAIVLMFIVAWPVAKLLDLILGENHGMVYRRAELKELIDFHSKQAQHGGDLSIDAVTIMRGALDLQEKKVKNSMTYIDDVFMLHSKTTLDRSNIQRIVESGHSRIPIYDYVDDEASRAEVEQGHYSEVGQRRKIIGCLLAKNLLLIDPDDNVPLSKVSINHIPSVQDDLPLFDILNIFQEGRSHLAIVVNSPPPPMVASTTTRSSSETIVDDSIVPHLWSDEEMARLEPIGIITLEDVLEELIQEPIWDETDTAEPRPRGGLAVPLQGTGESLILATNRGRPVSRRDTPEVNVDLEKAPRSLSGSLRHQSSKRSSQIEMVSIRRATGLDPDLSDYQISRSNSAAPADAKIPGSTTDPFAEEYSALVSHTSPLGHRASNPRLHSVKNKHLTNVKVSRPLSGDIPLRTDLGGTGKGKNRFKSRSTSSSAHVGTRRTQSAHTPSDRADHAYALDPRFRGSTFIASRRNLSEQIQSRPSDTAVGEKAYTNGGGMTGSPQKMDRVNGGDHSDENDYNNDDDDDDEYEEEEEEEEGGMSGMSMSAHNIGRI